MRVRHSSQQVALLPCTAVDWQVSGHLVRNLCFRHFLICLAAGFFLSFLHLPFILPETGSMQNSVP